MNALWEERVQIAGAAGIAQGGGARKAQMGQKQSNVAIKCKDY